MSLVNSISATYNEKDISEMYENGGSWKYF